MAHCPGAPKYDDRIFSLIRSVTSQDKGHFRPEKWNQSKNSFL